MKLSRLSRFAPCGRPAHGHLPQRIQEIAERAMQATITMGDLEIGSDTRVQARPGRVANRPRFLQRPRRFRPTRNALCRASLKPALAPALLQPDRPGRRKRRRGTTSCLPLCCLQRRSSLQPPVGPWLAGTTTVYIEARNGKTRRAHARHSCGREHVARVGLWRRPQIRAMACSLSPAARFRTALSARDQRWWAASAKCDRCVTSRRIDRREG
jgi:hypothetical protein